MEELILSFLVLSFLEIILGIDNIVFISLIANKVKANIRARVRFFGLLLSLVLRVIMLFFIALLLKLTAPLYIVLNNEISVRDLIMITAGIFLVIKGSLSLYEEIFVLPKKTIEQQEEKTSGIFSVIIQIIIIDFVFSLDSLITAVGLSKNYYIIAGAIIVSGIFMIIFSPKVSYFIDKHPELKILAILFIFLIGFILMLEGLDFPVNKSYLYSIIVFSLIVEILNIIKNNIANKAKNIS